jgi:hypothetical protein
LLATDSKGSVEKLLIALFVPTTQFAPESDEENIPPELFAITICVQVLSQAAPRQSLYEPVFTDPRFTELKPPPTKPMRGMPCPVDTFLLPRSAITIFAPSPLTAPAQPPPRESLTEFQVWPELVEYE